MKATRPVWMPMTAQPVALSVFKPSVKTVKVLRPSLEDSQILWLAVYDFLSSLGHTAGSMKRQPTTGNKDNFIPNRAFCEWKGLLRSM